MPLEASVRIILRSLLSTDSSFTAVRLTCRTSTWIRLIQVNTGVFRPLLSNAQAHDLRIVLLNMRDYPGTSSYTADEAHAFSNSSTQSDSLRRLGRQIGSFMEYFVRTFAIPAPKTRSDGEVSGGLVLTTWSLSNLLSMSLLGNAHTLKQETKEILGKYWRKLIMYGEFRSHIGGMISALSKISPCRPVTNDGR